MRTVLAQRGRAKNAARYAAASLTRVMFMLISAPNRWEQSNRYGGSGQGLFVGPSARVDRIAPERGCIAVSRCILNGYRETSHVCPAENRDRYCGRMAG